MTNTIQQADNRENIHKYYNYKEQFKRLNKAIKVGFYLEAMFIEYAILEDRTDAILRYEGNSIKVKGDKPPSINKKLNKIKTIAREKKSLSNRYFKEEFIDRIWSWKEKRNRMIHDLLKQQLTTTGLAQLAEEGKALAEELRNKASNYKRAVERKNKQES